MEQAFRQNAQVEGIEPSVPGVSWAAVLAGAVASLALTLVLLSFGVGMGFSVVSPWGNSGVSATTFKIGTGLYFIVMAMISSAIGGYLAGRLRTKWVGVQTTEVHFRDTAHGFPCRPVRCRSPRLPGFDSLWRGICYCDRFSQDISLPSCC